MDLSLEQLWRNYQEAMDMLVLGSQYETFTGADFYAAVARVSIDTYFERIEQCLSQTSSTT